MTGREHPFTLGDLVDAGLDELTPERATALEEHLFECPVCAARLDDIDRVAAGVRSAAIGAKVGANVSAALLDRAAADGLTLREYRLEPGHTVACSAGPEDWFVVRLAGDFGGMERLTARVDFRDLTSGEAQTLPPRDVLADVDRGEIVLIFPGGDVRAFPRSVWTISVDGEVGGRSTSFGPFVMDHTP